MQIYYYVNNERFAYRNRPCIPRVGDEVRLNNTCYKVALVVWIEDQKRGEEHVAIQLEEPKPSKQKRGQK